MDTVRQMAMRNASEVVVVRVLCEAPVQESPRKVVDRILLVGDCFSDHLAAHVIRLVV